tara:strand:- start:346 stop:687 length:342 start_codon:yes stop_codon:yes gene_type:complete
MARTPQSISRVRTWRESVARQNTIYVGNPLLTRAVGEGDLGRSFLVVANANAAAQNCVVHNKRAIMAGSPIAPKRESYLQIGRIFYYLYVPVCVERPFAVIHALELIKHEQQG